MVRAHLDRTFGALADPARLAVVALLRKKPLRSSEIANALALTRPTMSRHLKILRDAGVVEETGLTDDARARVYHLRPQPFSDVRHFVEEVEALWSEQLLAFKAHVESKHARPRR